MSGNKIAELQYMIGRAQVQIRLSGEKAVVGVNFKGRWKLHNTRRLFGNHGPTGRIVSANVVCGKDTVYVLFDANEVIEACEAKLKRLTNEVAR